MWGFSPGSRNVKLRLSTQTGQVSSSSFSAAEITATWVAILKFSRLGDDRDTGSPPVAERVWSERKLSLRDCGRGGDAGRTTAFAKGCTDFVDLDEWLDERVPDRSCLVRVVREVSVETEGYD
jgi:hypothetical protein